MAVISCYSHSNLENLSYRPCKIKHIEGYFRDTLGSVLENSRNTGRSQPLDLWQLFFLQLVFWQLIFENWVLDDWFYFDNSFIWTIDYWQLTYLSDSFFYQLIIWQLIFWQLFFWQLIWKKNLAGIFMCTLLVIPLPNFSSLSWF